MNYLAILVSVIVVHVIGGLWYGPLFGKHWMKLAGYSKKDLKDMKKTAMRGYVGSFIALLISLTVLASFLSALGSTDWRSGMTVAFMIWLGFFAMPMLGSVWWENKPFKLYLLNVLHWLVALLVSGAIVGVWQ